MERSEKRLFDVFNEMVETELPNHHNSIKETFHKINDEFENKNGFKPYKSYNSYKAARSRDRKRR
jgi:hypothetical protein